jgi:hypothetical protein
MSPAADDAGMGRNARVRSARRDIRVDRRRRRDDGWRIERLDASDARAGPRVVLTRIEDVLRAIENAPSPDDWAAIREIVVPVFPRARPFAAGYPTPLTTLLPPGVAVAFAAEVGPAFLMLSARQLEVLRITQAELVAQAFANLLARAEQVRPESVIRDTIVDVPIAVLQTGLSIGSTLLLVPDQLLRLFGPTPAFFVAPMRDLLIGLPADVDVGFAAWLFEEFASQDPNCLPPNAYRFDGTRVSTASLGGIAAVASRRHA